MSTPYIIKVDFVKGDSERHVDVSLSDAGVVRIALDESNNVSIYNASDIQRCAVHKLSRRCRRWLQGGRKPIIIGLVKPILGKYWSEESVIEVWAIRQEIINNITQMLLYSREHIVKFRDNDIIFQDLNVGCRNRFGERATVISVSVACGQNPVVHVDMGNDSDRDIVISDTVLSTDDLANINDCMVRILLKPKQVSK